MMVSVRCPDCKADMGSAPVNLTDLVAPALAGAHQCRVKKYSLADILKGKWF